MAQELGFERADYGVEARDENKRRSPTGMTNKKGRVTGERLET